MRLNRFAAQAALFFLPSLGITAPAAKKPVAAQDDPYGVSVPKKDTAAKAAMATPVPAPVQKDSGKVMAQPGSPTPDSAAKAAIPVATAPVAKDSVPTAPADTSAKAAPASAPTGDSAGSKKTRSRLVRETTVNSLNEMKGRYRSPKQALFMSLVIPGLGQAYVGQNAFNYARAVAYLGVDVTLGVLWHQYVVVKHDRQVTRYRDFADRNWSQTAYEDAVQGQTGTQDQFDARNPFRESYCDAVQSSEGATGNALNKGCKDPKTSSQYLSYKTQIKDFSGLADSNAAADSTRKWRESFPNVFYFYELIGKEQEFVTGWRDAQGVSFDTTIAGTSVMRDRYISMRQTANRYARMQAWFLGGIVVNHIVSALDAALTARYHNKALYQTDEARWYDRVHLNSALAFDGLWPRTEVVASIPF